jgi:pyrroloquinoline-quinone synthase
MTIMQDTTFIHSLDGSITRYSLLQHPFYVAWSMGELPVEALRDYAREYGAFIATVAQGWRTAGIEAIAAVEDHHTRVWESTFAASLDTAITDPEVKEVKELVAMSREMFSDDVTALGALYAFESQQPYTAQSKLKGLRDHYTQLPSACGEYFRLHEMDYDEPAILAHKINALAPEDQRRALDACQRMSQALYGALTGIYASYRQ